MVCRLELGYGTVLSVPSVVQWATKSRGTWFATTWGPWSPNMAIGGSPPLPPECSPVPSEGPDSVISFGSSYTIPPATGPALPQMWLCAASLTYLG